MGRLFGRGGPWTGLHVSQHLRTSQSAGLSLLGNSATGSGEVQLSEGGAELVCTGIFWETGGVLILLFFALQASQVSSPSWSFGFVATLDSGDFLHLPSKPPRGKLNRLSDAWAFPSRPLRRLGF